MAGGLPEHVATLTLIRRTANLRIKVRVARLNTQSHLLATLSPWVTVKGRSTYSRPGTLLEYAATSEYAEWMSCIFWLRFLHGVTMKGRSAYSSCCQSAY